MKLLIVSDAASPQVNGVVRTLTATIAEAERRGWTVQHIHPGLFKTIPAPGYPEIRLAVSTRGMAEMIRDFDPDCVHIATESVLGWAARRLMLKWGWAYTSAYHTDFPGYAYRHYRMSKKLTYGVLRRFHSHSAAVLVPTRTVMAELAQQGFQRLVHWGRGVDTSLFRPRARQSRSEHVLLNVGRVSKEKNLEAFLDLDVPGQKVVVGSGPMLDTYRGLYPEVRFLGGLHGEELAAAYADADCFVFPSRTDTFGLVNIEAIACGTPVAAYPVQGPIDIVTSRSGCLSDDLREAVLTALTLDRAGVAQEGERFTWGAATTQFLSALVPVR